MIEFKSVNFGYSTDRPLLENFSLSFGQNEILGVLGPNGAGKTSLVRLINGLLRPQMGQIIIDGQDIKDTKISQIAKKVGIVFQNSSYHFFAPTVKHELAYTLQYPYKFSQEKEERIKNVLKLFRLQNLSHRSPFTLSGGEKRRLAIAIAYILDPLYFVLDEPTIGQDLQGQQELRSLLVQFKNEGRGVLITSHDIEFIYSIADRIIILVDGQIIKMGTLKTIFSDLNLLKDSYLPEPQLVTIFRALGEYYPELRLLPFKTSFIEELIEKLRGKHKT